MGNGEEEDLEAGFQALRGRGLYQQGRSCKLVPMFRNNLTSSREGSGNREESRNLTEVESLELGDPGEDRRANWCSWQLPPGILESWTRITCVGSCLASLPGCLADLFHWI